MTLNPLTSPTPPGGAGNTAFATTLGLLLLRLAVGSVFFFHGAQKCWGWFGGHGIDGFAHFLESQHLPLLPALAWAWIAAGTEFFGGVLLLLGLLTRLACVGLIVTMWVAIATVTGKAGFDSQHGGYEYNLVLIAALAMPLLAGAGLVSADAFFFRRGLFGGRFQPLSGPVAAK